MNPKLDPIFARRSVRKFEDGEISDETVKDLLEAAMAAPSAVKTDPWEFIIVRDQAMLDKMVEGMPNGPFLTDASLGIVVCGANDRAHDGKLSYMIQDCTAAVENLLLAVSMLGLGACWLGVHPREQRMEHLQKILEIPENVTPLAVLAIGIPAKIPEARTRYNTDFVHHGKW